MVLATQGEKIDKTCFAAYLIWVPLRTREPSLVDLAIQKSVTPPILSLYILKAFLISPYDVHFVYEQLFYVRVLSILPVGTIVHNIRLHIPNRVG